MGSVKRVGDFLGVPTRVLYLFMRCLAPETIAGDPESSLPLIPATVLDKRSPRPEPLHRPWPAAPGTPSSLAAPAVSEGRWLMGRLQFSARGGGDLSGQRRDARVFFCETLYQRPSYVADVSPLAHAD